MRFDTEIMKKFAPEPPTTEEIEWRDKLSPDEFSIYSKKLELITEEGKISLIKTGVSPAIQTGDCITGIYSAAGDLCLACAGTYLHVATGVIPIKYILKNYKDDPTVGIKDGDAFFVNDPLYGGIHVPDMINIVPIFWGDRLIAWTAACTHEPECGGIVPADIIPIAKSRFEEGYRCLPIKIVENFQFRRDILDNFANQLWSDHAVIADMKARIGSCYKIRERFLELAKEKGYGFLIGLLRKITDSVAETARERIAKMNDGIYRQPLFLDKRGQEEGLGCVHVSVEKKGDEIIIDLNGSSPPAEEWLNSTLHGIRSETVGELLMDLFADLPISSSVCASFKFKAPYNTCVNPPWTAAITGTTRMGTMVVDALHVCFAKMMYDSDYRERVTTPKGNVRRIAGSAIDQYGGTTSLLGTTTMNCAGGGARTWGDGEDAANFWPSGFIDSLDTEHHEAQMPFLYLFRGLPTDQCGFGKYRGGVGASELIIMHNLQGPGKLFTSTTTSRFSISYGLFGGYYGGMAPFIEIRQYSWEQLFTQTNRPIPYNYVALLAQLRTLQGKPTYSYSASPIKDGDAVATVGAPCGGFGDVLEREPESVIEDLRKSIISDWVARNVYKVAYDGENMKVDYAKTEELRSAERAARKERGRPYSDFIKEWVQKKPRDEILRLYGPWPEGVTREQTGELII